MAEIAETWELAEGDIIDPLPAYAPGVEGYVNRFAKRILSRCQAITIRRVLIRLTAASTCSSRRTAQELWMNPLDASERSIKDGDKVQVFNDRGYRRDRMAKVTPRIMPGVVSMGQGTWHDADMSGEQGGQGRLHQHADLSSPDAFGEG